MTRTRRPLRRHRHHLGLLLAVALLASCTQWGGQEVSIDDVASTTTVAPDRPGSSTTSTTAPADPGTLDWRPCGALECATLEVPVDHDQPEGPQLEIALARRAARNPAERIGAVLVNPGGPGGSGIEMLSYLPMPPAVTERFDVVGFDPRGVGDSTPLDCRTHLQAIYDADPTMEDQTDVDRFREVSQAFVDECADRHGDLLPHLGTEAVARDLDRIRAALGDEQLTYVGYSYGTSIGQTYARLFPERVRAMVLDGVVDLTRTGVEGAEGQAAGFTRALDAYLADCDRRNCLGRPAAEVLDEVMLRAESAPIPAARADRPATPGVVAIALARALYSDLLWPQLTRALTDAAAGDGTGLVGLADDYLGRSPDGTYPNGFEVYFAVSCLDTAWPDSFEELLDQGRQVGARYPRLGEALVNDYARCALWPHDPEPLEPIPADLEGLAPIVYISTTGDPATPHESGVRTAAATPGARLITNVGEGHTVFANGKACVDDAVTAYLVDLTLPPEGLRCE